MRVGEFCGVGEVLSAMTELLGDIFPRYTRDYHHKPALKTYRLKEFGLLLLGDLLPGVVGALTKELQEQHRI